MKRIFFTLILTISVLSSYAQNKSDQEKKEQAYTPKYAQSWDSVYTYVAKNWGGTAISDPERLPNSFLPITDGNPIFFYWDNYFTNAGALLVDSLSHYAKNAADNCLFLVDSLGFVPNANREWGMNRSMTPYVSMMAREVYENQQAKDKAWLKKAYTTLKKEYHFWTDSSAQPIEDHTTAIPGLQRFFHHATDQELIELYDRITSRFGLEENIPDSQKIILASPYAAEAETMDFTPRFERRCPDFVAIDLSSNLYLYEKNFAWMAEELGIKDTIDWQQRAEQRKALINQHCWNEERGLFMDYDFVNKLFANIACISSVYPLWAGIATKEQAQRFVDNLDLFEYPFGVTVCKKEDQPFIYQWDYPAGWPPVYYLVIDALNRYGYKDAAKRIAAKYLDAATKNFQNPIPQKVTIRNQTVVREPGHLYEKYHVVNGELYDAEYKSIAFWGWSAGVFVWSYHYLKN